MLYRNSELTITHYPPLTSLVYSLPMVFGVDLATASSIIAGSCWVAFLSGMGLLAYRLSKSMLVTNAAVLLATLSVPFLTVFGSVGSEVLFLPVLVWTAWVFTGLPTVTQSVLPRMAIGAILLGILLLTRYSGVFFYSAIIFWWVLWRLFQRKQSRLLIELPIFALAAVPLLAWIVRNAVQTGHSVGTAHMQASEHSFADGLLGIVREMQWVFIPSADLSRVLARVGFSEDQSLWMIGVLITVSVIAGGLFAFMLRNTTLLQERRALLVHTPIPMLLLAYLGFYAVAQPFFLFTPLDTRDMASVLCLLQPLILAMLWKHSNRLSYAVFVGYLGLTTLVFGANLVFDRSTVPWLYDTAARTQDLALYHPDLLTWLQDSTDETDDATLTIITNSVYLIAAHTPQLGQPSQLVSLDRWLASEQCKPGSSVVVVIFEGVWERTNLWTDATTLIAARDRVVEQCPSVEPMTFQHSIVYDFRSE
jgi:hypothetical protein